MIDALLAIIDRLIQLRQWRRKRLQVTYQQLLEPLFNDLLLVHGDYIKMFCDTLDSMPRELAKKSEKCFDARRRDALEQAIDNLAKRRKELEPVRVKIQAVSGEVDGLLGGFGPEAAGFIEAVVAYFGKADVEIPRLELLDEFGNVSLRLIEDLEEVRQVLVGSRRTYLEGRRIIRHNIHLQERRWSQVCISFAKLKVAVSTGMQRRRKSKKSESTEEARRGGG